MADVYRAKEPFSYTDKKGVPRQVAKGDLMFSDNPNLKGKEKLFERVEEYMTRTTARVEEATAEPGQLRSVSTPRRGRRTAEPPTVTPKADKAPEPKKEGDES